MMVKSGLQFLLLPARLIQPFWADFFALDSSNSEGAKVWILEEVTSERCPSDRLNTFFITKGSEVHLSEVTYYEIHILVNFKIKNSRPLCTIIFKSKMLVSIPEILVHLF